MGEVKVPAAHYWGAQTQRAIKNFDICIQEEKMPMELIKAVALIKHCAAEVNAKYGIPRETSEVIQQAADEVNKNLK